jgi:hypothetical protein
MNSVLKEEEKIFRAFQGHACDGWSSLSETVLLPLTRKLAKREDSADTTQETDTDIHYAVCSALMQSHLSSAK